MAAGRIPLFTALVFAAALAAPALLPAQESNSSEGTAATPDVPNTPYNFIGEVHANNVYVRSGPSDSYYPTTKLSAGTRVTVRGVKHNYLKIEPPPGSFSYVGKAYVNRTGDGSKGRATTAANVRAGSELNSLKTTVQAKLDPGTEVTIRGEQEEYFKIDPPAGSYLYVQKDYVTPKERIPAEGQAVAVAPQGEGQPQTGDQPPQQPPAEDRTGTTGAIADAATRGNDESAGVDRESTADTDELGATTDAQPDTQSAQAPASTRPNDSQPTATADARFEQLEADFEAAGRQSVIEQPVDDLLAGYQALVKDESLPESLKRIADARIAALKVRKQTRDEFAAVRKSQEEMNARRQALQAEREELEEQIKATQVEFFAAVGTLRTSSLQQGPRGTTLYRLTDPASGRTLVYVRASSRDVAALLNQFVGVKGELTSDPLLRMKVITPTEAKAVDQTKVGTTVAAGLIPTSLLRNTPTVTTDSAPLEGQ